MAAVPSVRGRVQREDGQVDAADSVVITSDHEVYKVRGPEADVEEGGHEVGPGGRSEERHRFALPHAALGQADEQGGQGPPILGPAGAHHPDGRSREGARKRDPGSRDPRHGRRANPYRIERAARLESR